MLASLLINSLWPSWYKTTCATGDQH